LHAPDYLRFLYEKLTDQGVVFVNKRINSLDELYDLSSGPCDIVINASGLGARSLIGVEDPLVYPIRGQTVLVKTDVKVCLMGSIRSSKSATHTHPDESMYIIPRPHWTNEAILGGCFQENNFDPLPDYDLARRILERAHEACPALAGPNGQSWKDIEIISHNVGAFEQALAPFASI
jgi:D-amino-acid oxidase